MKTKLQKRFEYLVSSMNLPETRKHYTHENVLYFLRNGSIVNTLHKNFNAAMQVARDLI